MKYPEVIEIPGSDVKLIRKASDRLEYIAVIPGSSGTIAGAIQEALLSAKKIEKLFPDIRLKYVSHRKVAQSREKTEFGSRYEVVLEVLFSIEESASAGGTEQERDVVFRKIAKIYEQLAAVDENVPLADIKTKAEAAGVMNAEVVIGALVRSGHLVETKEGYIRRKA